MSGKLVFVDTETTGLDPRRHEIWEVAAIVREPFLQGDGTDDPEIVGYEDIEYEWQLRIDESRADLIALNIGRYFERRMPIHAWTPKHHFASEFQALTIGAHLVGAIPSFDEERLRQLLLSENKCPAWHYHIVDVEAMVAAIFRLTPPWKSDNLWPLLGIDRDQEQYAKHTAMGDARLARDVYDKVMGITP